MNLRRDRRLIVEKAVPLAHKSAGGAAYRAPVITVKRLRGTSSRDLLTGHIFSALVARVRSCAPEGCRDLGDEDSELMTMTLEPLTCTGSAHHMAALAMFMLETRREFPLDMRNLFSFAGFLYSRLIKDKVPKI